MLRPRESLARSRFTLGACVAASLFAAGCATDDTRGASGDAAVEAEADPTATNGRAVTPPPPVIRGLNAFYYYEDVEAAWAFYRDLLGFETVADFGFAKIMRVAPTSFVTLVDESRGMHSSDEPKSVTLAVVTEEVEAWYEYLSGMGVPMRADLNVREGSAHDGFVAIDPEGYLLEFERFNEHPENEALMPRLAQVAALGSASGGRPDGLDVQATVLWLYYDDLVGAQSFYEELLAVDLLVDQGCAKVYPVSSTGYVGLVDGSRGLHQATEEKAVTLSFLTDDVDGWLERAAALGVELRSSEIGNESDRVRTLVGYDVEGYFLEWDTFLDVEPNRRLLDTLR